MHTVSLFDAKTHLSRIVEELRSGKEDRVVIARHGKPVALVTPATRADVSRRIGLARGRFEVLSKAQNPVWRKPDWAFVEEGEPIPKNPADRLDYGALGEYALYFGHGFMIHGTLYERLLGRAVSHGCIRVGRDDLRKVYAAAPIGTPIYIY